MVREHILNPREFWRPFPLPALSADDHGYTDAFLDGDLGCNWRAYTWIPTNYYVFHGLIAYGYAEPARELARITYDRVTHLGDREYYATEPSVAQGWIPFWAGRCWRTLCPANSTQASILRDWMTDPSAAR